MAAASVAGQAGGQRCFRNAGQLYAGDVCEDGSERLLRHGLGRQTIQAKTVCGESVTWGVYTGNWRQDKLTGSGTFRWSDGSAYEGAFLDGRPHGHGKFTWPEGSTYDGMWQDGEMHGQGSFKNAFLGHTRHGLFHRNCLQLHDGGWLNVSREREDLRSARLRIGAQGPGADVHMRVLRCKPSEVVDRVAMVLREPPHLVPLLLADSSCPVQPMGFAAGPQSAAPLWCLQQGDRGCNAATTVHLSFAAAERRRRRDYHELFRSAIRESLLTYRVFALAFGEDNEHGHPQDAEAPAPACWSLSHFFDDTSLPLDLFDLRHFQGSGGPQRFLPAERRGWRCAPEVEGAAEDSSAAQRLGPATVYLLHFALASLRLVEQGLDDNAVRAHVGLRFSEHFPLHRVAALVISGEA